MANPITDIKSAKQALIEAVKAVTNTNNTGANDQWLKSLEDKAETNKEAKAKVGTLKFFDGILRSSINPSPSSLDEESQLGRLVSEIQGYQVLTERFVLELGALTVTDQLLEEEASRKRSNLFETLDRVQNWLLAQAGRTSPSAFDACTRQFLERMQAGRELALTQQLFNNRSPELMESDLLNLTNAWGNVVSSFVEDAQVTNTDDKVIIGDSKTIESFFCIHERLETLYSRLGTNVSLVN
jgi:hypothetical protein